MLLPPPVESSEELLDEPLDELVGVEGTATSRLAPAGKAWLGGRMHDVASDGALIEPGTPVRMVAVRNGRVYVQRA